MKITTIIIIAFAVFAGLVAALMVRSIVSRPKEMADLKIVVASHSLTYGSSVSADDLQEIPWSAQEFPEGAFRSIAEIIKPGEQGRYSLANISKSAPVLSNQITNPGQKASLAAALPEGKIAVTIRVDDVRGVAGFIMPGDHVDVSLTRTDNATHEGYVDTFLRNMKVLAIDQISKERQDTAQIAKSVTLEATSVEAEKLRLAGEVGNISLTLRNADDESFDEVGRITTSDLTSGDLKNKKQKNIEQNIKNGPATTAIRIIKGGNIQQLNVINELN